MGSPTQIKTIALKSTATEPLVFNVPALIISAAELVSTQVSPIRPSCLSLLITANSATPPISLKSRRFSSMLIRRLYQPQAAM